LFAGIHVFYKLRKLEILQLEQDNHTGGSWLSQWRNSEICTQHQRDSVIYW